MGNDINSYLVFKLDDNEFAIHVSKVVEILEYKKPMAMPDAPPFFAGVIEHREEMVPVVDPSLKFGLPALSVTQKSCIVVLELIHSVSKRPTKVAIIVDAVSDVIETEEGDLKVIQNDFRPEYILGTYKKDDLYYLVLNADKVFSTNEMISMSEIIDTLKKR